MLLRNSAQKEFACLWQNKWVGVRDCAIITWRGAGKWVKYAPKLSHTPPLIKQKLISTLPHKTIILRLTPPPPPPLLLKIVSSHWFPHTQLYLLDFSLRYKHHFKWLFDVCWRVIRRVIRITGLWACVVFAWIGRFLIFYSFSGTKVPACVGENSGIPVWLSFFFLKLNLIILCFIYHTLNLYRF